jgi:Fe-S cluster assembly protein SufD
MTDFMQRSLDAAASAAPQWLRERQIEARARWLNTPLPTRKNEAWKYTSLHGLKQAFSPSRATGVEPAMMGLEYPSLGGTQLVFLDGHYRSDLSRTDLPSGAQLVRFSEADASASAVIREHLGTAVPGDRHPFASLNDAALAEGVFINLEAGTIIDKPIQLVWLATGQEALFSINQRLLLRMGANSRATLVEHFAAAGKDSTTFTNGISELLLDDGACLDHYRLHLEQERSLHIGGVHAQLAANSTLQSFHLAFGSDLKRLDVVVDHRGEGAHCELNGIYLPRGAEHIDYHTCIEHSVPRCTSSESFRGIISDQASAVFNGRIHIHPDAQKSRAELSNKNLLTSAEAEINTKPELEIYADDVQCAHGATVAQTDPETLHYLRSRGVPRAQAEIMLNFGFINELVEGVRCEVLRDYLKPLLAQRFARDPGLARESR